MKKSQILAALALAFALGVATPVLGTANTVSAISFADPAVEGSKDLASGTEVANAIAAIEADSTYKLAETLIDTAATFKDGVTKNIYTNDFTASSAAGAAVVAEAKTAGLTEAVQAEGADMPTGNEAEIKAVIASIEANKTYTAYNDLDTAIQAASKTKDRQALVDALNAFYSATDATNKINFSDDTGTTRTFDQIMAIVNDTNSSLSIDYDKYQALSDDIEAAEEALTIYNDSMNLVKPVLTNDILSAAGKTALENATDPEDYVAIIVNSSNEYQSANFDFDLAKYATLKDAVEAATPYDNKDTKANWDKIEAIAIAYKAATNSTELTTKVMTELAGATVETPNYDEPRYIYSADGKVAVLGVFPEGTILEVKEVTADSEALASFKGRKLNAYDIVLKNADGSAFDLKDQKVTVSIAVTNNIDGAKSDVYYVAEDGKATKLDATYADSTMTFTATHFSIYAIVERAVGAEIPGGTNTGIVSSSDATAKASVSIMAAIATALTAAGAAVVAFRRNRAAKKN